MATVEHVVVIGASLAGLRAAEAARRAGFRGRLTLVGDESHLPYDRPPLSKAYLDGPPVGATHLSAEADLATALMVDLRLGAPAHDLDTATRTVSVGHEVIGYDALVIATGARPRTLPGTGHLTGVCTLRTLDDADLLRTALDAQARTVVIGAGFIGSEIASAARKRGLPVTVLEAMPTPLVRAVGEQAGRALSELHHRNGTDLRCGVAVDAVEGDDRVTGVRLTDGTVIPADLVVVGIGAAPVTEWLTGSGLTIDNGVVCDSTLWAGAPGVWAAGDVARWESPDFGSLMRLEHWTNAAEQGAHAMRNALSEESMPYSHIPYFWSDWYDSRIQFVGVPHGEPKIVSGSWEGPTFAAVYHDDDRLVGALTLNRRADIMKYRAMIGRRATLADAVAFAGTRSA